MKIFEIGVMKTGTSSLGKAFEILNFKHLGWNPYCHNLLMENKLEPIFGIIDQYDAFEDGPWHNMDFRILDKDIHIVNLFC